MGQSNHLCAHGGIDVNRTRAIATLTHAFAW